MAVPDDNGGKAPAGRTNFRTWTDDTGQHTTEAALVDFSDGQVRLRTADGSVLTVPVDRLSQADREFLRGEAPGGRTDAEGPGFLRRQAGLQAEASDVRCTAGDRARDSSPTSSRKWKSTLPPRSIRLRRIPGKTARMKCTCDLVCKCESVSACGCNLVKTRNPIDLGFRCACDTVLVCTCDRVTSCSCDKVRTRSCDCEAVATCTCEPFSSSSSKCGCEGFGSRPSRPQCACLVACGCVGHFVCPCQRVGGGGGSSGSVCNCVPVIH